MQELSDIEKKVPAPAQTATSEPGARDASLVGATGKAHRAAGATGVLLLVALMGILGIGSAHPAQAATPPSGTTIAPAITITGVEAGGLMQLTATLTSTKGQPLPNAQVAFLFSTTEFGAQARRVPLGSATTDKSGAAELTLGGDADHLYKPTVKGPQVFLASYTAAGAQPITSSTTVNVTAATSAYNPAPAKPLASVGNVLVICLFAIVAAIWLTLGTQIWRVRRVCRGVGATGSDDTGRSSRSPVDALGTSPLPLREG